MKLISSRTLNLIMIWMLATALLLPLSSAMAKHRHHGKTKVKVMTRNLYLGADIFKVVEAAFTVDDDGNVIPNPDPYAIPIAVANVYETMMHTNFTARAEAIADEVLRAKPHVIGIQEASTYYIQTPGDFKDGNPVQADELVIDFYTTLDAALKKRGLNYQAFFVTNADIEMPMFDRTSSTSLSDVRLVDHDIIMVKKGLKVRKVYADNYLYNLSLNLGGADVEFTRGFVSAEVKINGQKFRIVNTHLEVRSDEESEFRVIQALQMNELLGLLKNEKRPVIMLGDFNSSEDDEPFIHDVYGAIVPPYWQARYSGFFDSWLLQDDPGEGYTSGFDETVSDPTATLDTRIDLIFVDPKKQKIEKVKADVVGDEIEDMIPNDLFPGDLWPSDHAGVVAKIKFSKKRRH